MPQVDLTTLTETELRRLLRAARERGQAAQSYQILQEMAARRAAGGPGLFRARRPAEPRLIALDVGEAAESQAPEAAEDDDIPPLPPGWVPLAPEPQAAPAAAPGPRAARRRKPAAAPSIAQAQAAPGPEPRPEPRPLTSFRLEPAPAPPPVRAPGLPRWSGLIFAGGVALGVTFGWWAGEVTRSLLQGDSTAIVEAKAAAPSARPPAARPEPAPLAASTPIVQPALSDTGPAPSAAEFVQDASATAEAAATPRAAEDPAAEPVQIARAPPAGCAAEATPADRTICETPRLQRLQHELRRAYGEALLAHRDRGLLRERQLAWREARNDIAEPIELARVYGERIRRLHAAAADARRSRRRG